jgi:hypothetical protein
LFAAKANTIRRMKTQFADTPITTVTTGCRTLVAYVVAFREWKPVSSKRLSRSELHASL